MNAICPMEIAISNPNHFIMESSIEKKLQCERCSSKGSISRRERCSITSRQEMAYFTELTLSIFE